MTRPSATPSQTAPARPLPACVCGGKPNRWHNAVDLFAVFCFGGKYRYGCGARTPPLASLAAAERCWRAMVERAEAADA